MSLLLLGAISLPALSLWHSHTAFRALFALEEWVITIDNAAIELGRDERALFRAVQRSNQLALKLDSAHHASHACAHAPFAGAACRSADLAAERTLSVLHSRAGGQVQVAWRLAGERLAIAVKGKARIRRAIAAPLRSVRCAVCGLETRWELSQPPQTHLSMLDLPRTFKVVVSTGLKRLDGEAYQYRIREEEDE